MTVAELTARISVVGEGAARQAFSRLGTSARSMGEAIRSAADATRLLEVAGGILAKGSGISVAMAFDSQVRALAAYANNAQELEAQLVRLNEIAKLPGLGQSEVRMGVLSLEAAGLNARMAERAVSTFGNALALAGRGKSDLEGVIVQLGQIASKGKLSAEEIGIIAERVPQIRIALQGAFGTGNTEVIQKMGLNATDAINRIITELEKLPKATSGAQVNFENMADAIDAMVLPIGRGLLDMFQATTDSGGRMIDMITKMTTSIGEVLSAIGKSGALEEMLGILTESTLTFGKGWQQGFVRISAIFMAFVAETPRLWRSMVDDLSSVWSTFAANIGIEFRNSLRMMFQDLGFFAEKTASILGLQGAAKNIGAIFAPEQRKGYAERTTGTLFDIGALAVRFEDMILGKLGKQGLPDGLNFRRPGAQAGAGAAAADSDKKAKETKDLLQRIESNTRQTADILDLRNQTLGGGRLGQIGVTGSELAGMGMRVHSELSKAKPISSDTMVTRGIKQMIQNNLGFAVNGGRAIPIR
jgi:tape measure domain-containing protein